MENNEEKVRLLLQVNICGTKNSMIGSYAVMLGGSMAIDSLSEEEKQNTSVTEIYLIMRKIALKMRSLLIEDGVDENDLIQIEQQIFNALGKTSVKKHLQEIQDEIRDRDI